MMYSVLEQHVDGSWWYHTGMTESTEKAAEEHFNRVFWFDKNRPHKVVAHTKPFPQKDLSSFDCKFFGYGGITEYELE